MSESIHREILLEDVSLYVKRAELLRVAATLLLQDDIDDQLKLEYVVLPDAEKEVKSNGLCLPTAVMADAVKASIPSRSLIYDYDEQALATVIGYPRFSSRDSGRVDELRDLDNDELVAEITIPHSKDGATNLPGTMSVYILSRT